MNKKQLEAELKEKSLFIIILGICLISLLLFLGFTLADKQDCKEPEEVIWLCEEVNVSFRDMEGIDVFIWNLDKKVLEQDTEYAIMENKFCEKIKTLSEKIKW